jgi:hypothetical protein
MLCDPHAQITATTAATAGTRAPRLTPRRSKRNPTSLWTGKLPNGSQPGFPRPPTPVDRSRTSLENPLDDTYLGSVEITSELDLVRDMLSALAAMGDAVPEDLIRLAGGAD